MVAQSAIAHKPPTLGVLHAIQEANVVFSRLIDNPMIKNPIVVLESELKRHFTHIK
jgi:hypothetical protein